MLWWCLGLVNVVQRVGGYSRRSRSGGDAGQRGVAELAESPERRLRRARMGGMVFTRHDVDLCCRRPGLGS
jgi:hypothetical protein